MFYSCSLLNIDIIIMWKIKILAFKLTKLPLDRESFYTSNESQTLLECKGVTKRFGSLVAVDNVNLKVEEGKLTSLIGPNGAGKTTLINLITGFLKPDSGNIWFMGKNITGRKPSEIAKLGLSRTFQDLRPFYGLTLLENVMIGRLTVVKDVKVAFNDAVEILNMFNITDYNKPVEKATAAEVRFIGLARAVATNPRLLLLDEVAAGLNPREVEGLLEVIKILRDKGITILLVEHVMKVVMSISDYVVVLDQGKKIAEGKPKEITRNSAVIRAYLGETSYA